MVILAERSAFAKVISTVWNEAVDEAAHLTALELREIDPGVIAALSEAAHSFARSRIMDELIDECTVYLTGPEGDLWPDAKAMEAVADGVGYQVRCEVMSELIDSAVAELAGSYGEGAEILMLEAQGSLPRIRPEKKGEAREKGTVDRDDDTTIMDYVIERRAPSSHEGQQETEKVKVSSTRSSSSSSSYPSSSTLAPVTSAEAQRPRSSVDDTGWHGSSSEVEQKEGRANGEERTGSSDRKYRRSSGNNSGSSGSNGNDGMVAEVQAAVLVQSALRRKVVYREMKSMVARNFIRMYDPGEGAFYW